METEPSSKLVIENNDISKFQKHAIVVDTSMTLTQAVEFVSKMLEKDENPVLVNFATIDFPRGIIIKVLYQKGDWIAEEKILPQKSKLWAYNAGKFDLKD